jgi:hypothetical protein
MSVCGEVALGTKMRHSRERGKSVKTMSWISAGRESCFSQAWPLLCIRGERRFSVFTRLRPEPEQVAGRESMLLNHHKPRPVQLSKLR